MNIKGWHKKACEVLSTGGVCTCVHCQSNNLLQKIEINNKIFNDMQKEQEKQFNLPPELEGKKFRIRKLTPRECFRLMGVHDKDIDKIQSTGLSNSSQYKLAGNSIVVDVLYYMFESLFIGNSNNHDSNGQLSLF